MEVGRGVPQSRSPLRLSERGHDQGEICFYASRRKVMEENDIVMNNTPTAARAVPKAALLGRPNVGKSTLFNRLIRSNRAITHDRPGITRDRMEGVVRGPDVQEFLLVDTGGVTLGGHARVEQGPAGIRGFEEEILKQAREAVRESDLLCLVVDARDGLTPFDRHLADFLRREGKPLLLVVNKVDGPEREDLLMAEFHELGLPMLPCSAAHGYNVRALEEKIRESLFAGREGPEARPRYDGPFAKSRKRGEKPRTRREGQRPESEPFTRAASEEPGGQEEAALEEERPLIGVSEGEEPLEPEAEEALAQASEDAAPSQQEDFSSGPLRLALLGRPNAGKSSLVNALSGKNRMIVSEMAGTTRDSVDVSTEIDGEPCIFVDTAGVRRRARINDTVERYSVNSSIKSTTKAHVTLLVLDASEGLTQQDKRLIDLLNERKTPFMVLINKSDLIEPKLRKEAEKRYKEALTFCPHVPLLFVSAKNRHNLKKIVPLARAIRRECGIRISTGRLNRAMAGALEKHQPPVVRQVRPKFFYLTQAESLPPTFVFFVNDAERIMPSYARYLERALRKLFGISHAPMRINFRSSHGKKTGKR